MQRALYIFIQELFNSSLVYISCFWLTLSIVHSLIFPSFASDISITLLSPFIYAICSRYAPTTLILFILLIDTSLIWDQLVCLKYDQRIYVRRLRNSTVILPFSNPYQRTIVKEPLADNCNDSLTFFMSTLVMHLIFVVDITRVCELEPCQTQSDFVFKGYIS